MKDLPPGVEGFVNHPFHNGVEVTEIRIVDGLRKAASRISDEVQRERTVEFIDKELK